MIIIISIYIYILLCLALLKCFTCIISLNPHKDTMQWTLLKREEIKAQRKKHFARSQEGFNAGTPTPEPRKWDPLRGHAVVV